MPFVPPFMQQLDVFRAERDQARDLTGWKQFQRKWLNNATWPTKSDDQVRREQAGRVSPMRLGGRLWGWKGDRVDISPEARYEYFWTIEVVGRPLRFPDEATLPRTSAQGFYQYCPYCEIMTDDIGPEECPTCARQLLYGRWAE